MAQTIKIWKKNLDRLKRIEDARAEITGKRRLFIKDEEILAYAEEHYMKHNYSKVGLWNGRQIRNAFLTAAALAYHSAGVAGPRLTTDLFRNVANTTDEFDRYINSVHGEKSEEQRAYDHVERIDHPTTASGKWNWSTYPTQQPATPISDPRMRAFANNIPQGMQRTPEDSGYARHGAMMEHSTEHATFATSSAQSSRVFTDATYVPESVHASPGASVGMISPTVAARAARPSTMGYGQGYNNAMNFREG